MARLFASLIPILAIASLAAAAEPVRERIEWVDIWVTDADKDDLPRVLFIGDSITRGYFRDAEKPLEGKAYCARLATSKCVCDPSFDAEILLLLKQYRFDVIHFNNGLHGWGYSESDYRNGLLEFLATVNKHAPDAKLIWTATTPVRDSSDLKKFGELNGRVQARNRIAAEIMRQQDIPTDDLYELVADHPDWYTSDGVHFNEQGRAAQGAAAAASVVKRLAGSKSD